MTGTLKGAERRGNCGIGICSRGGYNVGCKGRVVSASVLCVEHKTNVKKLSLKGSKFTVLTKDVKQVLRCGVLGLWDWPMDEELLIDTSMADAEVIATLTPEDETESIIEYAVNNLPSIAIAKGKMDNALLDLKTARWQFTPSLSLNAGWSTSYYTYPGMEGYVPTPFHTQFRNNGGEYIQLSLSFPIFDRLSTFSNLRRKRNESRRATIQYEQKVREVEAEVIRAVQDRDGASAAFHQADRRAALQEEAYLLNLKKLEQGLISTIDFQKASDNWLNAKTSRLDALLKFYIKRSVVNYYNGISYINQ